jgi:hypothetical protein
MTKVSMTIDGVRYDDIKILIFRTALGFTRRRGERHPGRTLHRR